MKNTDKIIITCAVTGAIHTPTMSPYLPITPDEIARDALGAAEAGAAILHLHARDPETGKPDQRPEAFARFLPRIKQNTNAAINITTGGSPYMKVEERVGARRRPRRPGRAGNETNLAFLERREYIFQCGRGPARGRGCCMAAEQMLDLITIGRSCVDLYGEQVGGRLEDMGSFAKYVGGSPTNTAVGAARLGLRAGLLTRVGADHFGRFIREQLARECVDRGYYLSFSGTVTFKNAKALRDALASTPLDQVLVETDAPYLTPHPWRGATNSPTLVPLTVRAMASVLGVAVPTLCAALSENSERLYGPW